MSDKTTELETLSKLKMAGRLRYWRGTIEIPEDELHAICDEIQAEYDNAVHALNKAAGNWAKADAELREKSDMAMARATDGLRKSLDFMRIWISEDAHLGESAISRGLEKAEGLRKLDAIEQAIAATLGSGTCELTETDSYSNANEVIHVLECSACGETCEHVNGSYPRCPHCGRKVVDA